MQLRSLGRLMFSFSLIFILACYQRGGIVHRVESGESLSQLAHLYGVPVKNLLEANPRISSDELKVGERLLIPGVMERKNASQSIWESEEVTTQEDEEKEEISEATPTLGPTDKAKPTQVVKPEKTLVVQTHPKTRSVLVAPRKVVNFAWPATGAVVSKFGMRNQKMHNGIDIRLGPDSAVLATAEGKVVYVGNDVEGYGNLLIIHHPTNLFSVYAYVGEILVKKGMPVTRGTMVAKANSKAQDAFLHFELRRGRRALDPLQLLPK
jgi:murein DD-endopeptidase MepM/ murein hydrolase activator NlpD